MVRQVRSGHACPDDREFATCGGEIGGAGTTADRLRSGGAAGRIGVMAEGFQVGVASEVVEVAIAQFQGTLQGREGRVDHPQHGVAAREVVPGDGPVGQEADEPAVESGGPAQYCPLAARLLPWTRRASA